MSEQNPIQGLQFAAQLAPQALNPPAEANGIAASEFKKLLQEQGFSIESRHNPGLPVLPDGAEAGVALGVPQVLAGSLPGGNVLPQAGSKLQPAGDSPRQSMSLSMNPATTQIQEREISLVSQKSQALAQGQQLIAGEKEVSGSQPTTITTAARNLSSSLLVASSQSETAIASPLATSSHSEESSDVDKLLQNLLLGQQAGGKLESKTETGRGIQTPQQPSVTQVQPQGNIVTYTPVAQPANVPPPAESGLLSTAQPAQMVNIDVPVQNAEWSRAFAERAVWLVNNQQSAQVRVTPASLGQIDIQVRVNDDEASIVINTQNNFVKETVESSLPRLRDMLESQGLNLVDVNVNERQTNKHDSFESAFDQQEDGDDLDEGSATNNASNDMRPMMYVRSDAVDMYV